MALKPTIFKFNINIADFDREYFQDHSLTLAQHPSESLERMMVRCLAFILNASPYVSFTAGLSTPAEPDLWEKSLDGRLLLWLDVGEPGFERIKKACRQSQRVRIYSFNSKSEVWWRQNTAEFASLAAEFYQFTWSDVQSLAAAVERGMDFSASVSGDTIYITTAGSSFELPFALLSH